MLQVPRLDGDDYESIFQRARSRIPALTSEWTNFNAADPGITTLQTFAWLFDTLHYYMNASGEAVREAAAFYKLSPRDIIVICDDINLAPGKIRVRKKGSDGGQKGLRSIIEQLSSDEFVRVRMGVGAKPRPDYDLADWVLGEFPDEDKKLFFSAMEKVGENLSLIVGGDIDRAMNLLN